MYNDFVKLAEKNGFKIDWQEVNNIDGLSFDFDSTQLVWVDTNASNAVKIHELLHAVLNICSSRGIDREDDEVLCYMLEYLVKSL